MKLSKARCAPCPKEWAITVTPRETQLTIHEAADLPGVSRHTLIRRLDYGEISVLLHERHRRVTVADVITYSDHARANRGTAINEMARTSAEDGTDDTANEFVNTRS